MPKVGKTSLSTQLEKPLLLAGELGYLALPGVIAQDITSWAEFKQVLRELKKPEVKETFKSIVVDTIDLFTLFCEKYICAQQGVESIGDIAYGKGFKMVQKELEESFRSIAQMGYALFFISHAQDKTFTRDDGTQYNQIAPTLAPSYNRIIAGMSDIYAYAHTVRLEDGSSSVVLTLRSPDGSVETGCRFKYIAPEIPFTYEDLSKALNDAIDAISKNNGKKFVTNKPAEKVEKEAPDFDALMEQFTDMVHKLQDAAGENFGPVWAPRIVEITEKYLGKGKKVNSCSRDQIEQLELIVTELADKMAENDIK